MIGISEWGGALDTNSENFRRLFVAARNLLKQRRISPAMIDRHARIIARSALLAKSEKTSRNYEVQYQRRTAQRLLRQDNASMIEGVLQECIKDVKFSEMAIWGLVKQGQTPDPMRVRKRLIKIANMTIRPGRKKLLHRTEMIDFLLLTYSLQVGMPRWSPLSRARPVESWFETWSATLKISPAISFSEIRASVERFKALQCV